jgi:hypothetical protein
VGENREGMKLNDWNQVTPLEYIGHAKKTIRANAAYLNVQEK